MIQGGASQVIHSPMCNDHVICVLRVKGLEGPGDNEDHGTCEAAITLSMRRLMSTAHVCLTMESPVTAMTKIFPDVLSWPYCFTGFDLTVN